MILYHGSYLSVEKPDLSYSRNNVDFGKGFYTTPLHEQAVKWSERFKKHHGSGIVSAYELDENTVRKNTSILEFDTYSGEWLDFIVTCRRGKNIGSDADIIIGGVANDRVFNTLQLFFKGLIKDDEAIRRLRYEKPNIQYCFRNQSVIDTYLNFISMEEFQ
jgi:hypothetical protein